MVTRSAAQHGVARVAAESEAGSPGELGTVPVLPIVVLCTDRHLGSAALLHHLRQNPRVTLAGVVIARAVPLSWRDVPRLWRYVRAVGPRFLSLIGAQVLLQRLAFLAITLLDRRHRRIGSIWRALRRDRIPILRVTDVNGPEAVAFIAETGTEVLVSAYLNQILGPETLRLGSRAALNVHPSLLPAYRGLMSYFWVLRNDEAVTGVTVHRMNERIDAGPVIRQRAFMIEPSWTQHDVLFEATRVGAQLLDDVLEELARGKLDAGGGEPTSDRSIPTQAPSYYSFPSGADLRAYGRSRAFVAPAAIFRFLWRIGLGGPAPSARSSRSLEGRDHLP